MALDVANLGFQVDSSQLRTATTDLTAMAGAAGKAVQPVAAVGQAASKAGQGSVALGRATTASGGVFQRYGHQIQNTSYQLQDMVVQISMGTDAMRAMSMQLPQMLGGFGAWGALIGVAVGVLGGLVPMLLSTEDEADSLNDTLKDLANAQSNYTDAVDLSLTPLADLTAEFGRNAIAARELYAAMRDISLLEYAQQVNKSTQALKGEIEGVNRLVSMHEAATIAMGYSAKTAFALNAQAVKELRDEYGLTLPQAQMLTDALEQIDSASNVLDQANGMKAFADAVADAVRSGAEVPPHILEAARQAADLAAQGFRVANALDSAGASAGAATGQTYSWADAMASVAAQVNAVAAALSSIGGGMVSRAAMFVERNALAAGKTVAQARVEVEKFKVANEWDAQIMGARAKGGVFGAVATKAMEAAKAVDLANVEMAAQNAIITQNAAAAERAAAKAGGGGSKGKGGGGRAGALSDEAKAADAATQALTRLQEQHAILQSTIGMTEMQERAYRAAMDLGAGATEAQRLQVMQLVPEMARLEEQQQLIRDRAQMMQQGFRDLFTGVISGAKSAKDAIADLASRLADMMANRAFDALLGGGLGRFFGGDPLSDALSGAGLSGVRSFAGGGYTWDGPRAGGVDGHGGRFAILHPRETVVDHTKPGSGAMSYSPVFNIGGSVTAEDLAAVRRESAEGFAQMQRTMPQRVSAINRDPLRRSS